MCSCKRIDIPNVDHERLLELQIEDGQLMNDCKQIYFTEYIIKFDITDNWNQNWFNVIQQILEENQIKLSFIDDEKITLKEREGFKIPFWYSDNYGKIKEIIIHKPDLNSDQFDVQEFYHDLISNQ